MNTINYMPIIVASLVAFGLSSLWYSPILFGKEWMELRKISKEEVADMKNSKLIKSYLIQLVLTFVTFIVLGFIISMTDARTSLEGAFIGILSWLGFMIPIGISGLLWKKESFTLFLIDMVNNLVIMTIGGAIIGTWR